MPLEGVDWSLIMVGDGDLRPELTRRVAEAGWQDRVRFTGMVPLNEVPGYVRAMDCFVLGSRTTPTWIDTFPLVTVQAMACGVPVIGSDSASLPWQIGDAGLIFPEGDAAALRACILRLIREPELRVDLAERGRQRSLANFCVRGLAERFFDILQQVRSGRWRTDLPEEDQRRAYLP
jgi:glycosyltransferase involved in cell wall biosynthesis